MLTTIDELQRKWVRAGKKTRRNWWAVLAGTGDGKPRRVEGIAFPVLPIPKERKRRSYRRPSPAHVRPRTPPSQPKQEGARGATRGRETAPPSDARPFLKWAGGKRQLLEQILERIPRQFATLHEPFVGGGAVFFRLNPSAAILSDRNERLIRAYRGVRDAVDTVISLLKTFRNERDFYLEMRAWPVDELRDAEVAAWLIFLNKTGFNGLYRVNSRNVFNVPFGANAGRLICDESNLRACSAALANAELKCEDFSEVLGRAQPGDVVYFDPPYVPVSGTSYFTSYTSRGFTVEDQTRLRDVALALKKRGVFVLLSNSSAPLVRELYEGAFQCVPVSATRLMNSNPLGRGRVTEYLIF